MTDKPKPDISLYNEAHVASRKRVTVTLSKQLMQDLNLLMASHRMSPQEIILGSVHAQADAVRERVHNRLHHNKSEA